MQRILLPLPILAVTMFSSCDRPSPDGAQEPPARTQSGSGSEAKLSPEEERANAEGYRYGDQTTESTLWFRVGGLAPDDFTRRAQRHEAEIVALEVDSTRPGQEDEPLVVDYASVAARHAGWCRQAMENLERPALKLIAGAGASAQDIILGKLRKVAAGGNIALPNMPSDSTEEALGQAVAKEPAEEFDRAFIEEFLRSSAELQTAAARLRDQSKQATLSQLGAGADELLAFHVEVAREELANLSEGQPSGQRDGKVDPR